MLIKKNQILNNYKLQNIPTIHGIYRIVPISFIITTDSKDSNAQFRRQSRSRIESN